MKTFGYYLIMSLLCSLVIFGCSKPGNDQPLMREPPSPPSPPSPPPPVVPPTLIDSAVSLFIGGGDSLYAFEASNGKMKWGVKLGNYVMSSPAYWNGNVYVGCADKKLYAFDTTGKFKWSFLTDAYIGSESPFVDNGKVYINTGQGTIYCIDGITGQLVWQNKGVFTSGASLVVKDGTVYANGDKLIALDGLTGQPRWSYSTGGQTRPVVLNNKIYATGNTSLYVINATTGTLIWMKRSWDAFNDPATINVGNGYVYCLNLGTSSGITASDTLSGTLKWSTKNINIGHGTNFASGGLPVLFDSTLFFPGGYTYYAYNAFTGVLKWQRGIEETTAGGTVVNKIIYCNSRSVFRGRVVALDASTGLYKWASNVRNDFNVSIPCVVTKSGKMHRLGDVYN